MVEEKEKMENKDKKTKEKVETLDKRKDVKTSEKKADKKEESKEVKSENKEEKKEVVKKEIVKKDKAIVKGVALKISKKYTVSVCKMLRGKSPDNAVKMLEEVIKGKRAVPMHAREVPHQKGKGIAGAKYPRNVSIEMIKLIKQAKANAVVNGVENPVISIIKANQAPRPYRRNRTRGKRTHVYIELKSRANK